MRPAVQVTAGLTADRSPTIDASAKLDRAEEAVADLVSHPSVDSIYLGGSLTAGLGNARSDVDIFVVLADTDAATWPTEQRYVDDQRYDVEYVDAAWLASSLGTFEGFEVTKRRYTAVMDRTLESQADRLVRLHHSIPVLSSAAYESARRSVAAVLPDIRRFLVTSYTAQFMSYHEDCVGALESGHATSGLVISQSMLMAACEAFLCGAGDLYRGAKWVPARLARTSPDWGRLVDDLVAPGTTPSLDVVASRLRVGQSLVGIAQTFGWDGAEAATVAPPTPTPAPRAPVRGLPSLGWRASDGCVLARDYGTQLQVAAEGLLLWTLCDGRPRTEVLDAMCAARRGLARDEVDRYLDNLVERGVIVHAP